MSAQFIMLRRFTPSLAATPIGHDSALLSFLPPAHGSAGAAVHATVPHPSSGAGPHAAPHVHSPIAPASPTLPHMRPVRVTHRAPPEYTAQASGSPTLAVAHWISPEQAAKQQDALRFSFRRASHDGQSAPARAAARHYWKGPSGCGLTLAAAQTRP